MSNTSIGKQKLKRLLDSEYLKYNTRDFIDTDPISIPHSYSSKSDIEITAFWTAILSWGQRKTIINKAKELFALMGESPHEFILNFSEKDLKRLESFKHRTFQYADTLCFIDFFKNHYKNNVSLETAFLPDGHFKDIESSLNYFKNYFFSNANHLERTKKHVSSPERNSTCKRINMFLRWMVRKDTKGVDFGIWNRIPQGSLMIPYDVHVDRVARHFGLVSRKQKDWKTVLELTKNLRLLDSNDPVKYDFALFGMGVLNKL